MKGFVSIFHDTSDPDSPWSWKRIACSILLIALVSISIYGLALMFFSIDTEKAKWVGVATVVLDALFIITILVLMGYATSIEKAIQAARGNK